MRFPVSVGGSRFGIRTTSPEFGAWLEETLAGYRRVRPARFKYSAAIQEPEVGSGRRPIHVLYRWTGVILRTSSIFTLAHVLLEELQGPDLSNRRDAVYVAGGVFVVDGRAAMVPIITVPILNRAPLRAWRPGVRVSGGVAVAIEPGSGRVVPLPETLRIPPDALAGLAARYRPDPTRMFVEEPLAVEAVLRFRGSGDPVVQPDSRAHTLYELIPQALNLEAIGKGVALTALGRLMGGAHAYLTNAHRPIPTLTALTEVLAGPA